MANPTFIAYTVTKREGDKGDIWNEIGVAWQNENSISLKLAAVPVNGEIVLRHPRPKKEDNKSTNA